MVGGNGETPAGTEGMERPHTAKSEEIHRAPEESDASPSAPQPHTVSRNWASTILP